MPTRSLPVTAVLAGLALILTGCSSVSSTSTSTKWSTTSTTSTSTTGTSTSGTGTTGTGTTGTGTTSTSSIRFYADSSFWNVPIPSNPSIDPNSANIVATTIVPNISNAHLTNSSAWGISLATATSSSPLYAVQCTTYCTSSTTTFPIPLGAQPSTGSDHHLTVINPANFQELDLWEASYSSTTNTWSAGSVTVNDYGPTGWGACGLPGTHCNSSVAAGFAGMGGVVRPEEIGQGHIDHALSIVMTTTLANYIACPATHTDGDSTNQYAIPEGARIQMDPSFDVDSQSWPAWEKIIAHALQTYGAYVSDKGGSMAIYGQTDINAGNVTWTSVGVPENGAPLSDLPWNGFRVLTITSCN